MSFNKEVNRNIPLRPLNKGMRQDIPAQMMEVGSFRDVVGMIADQQGLRRSPPQSRELSLGAQLDPSTGGPIDVAFNFQNETVDEIIVGAGGYWWKAHPTSGFEKLTSEETGDNTLNNGISFVPDWTIYNSLGVLRALMVDGDNDTFKVYDGVSISTMSFFPDSERQTFPSKPNAITYFQDRVWVGCNNTLLWSSPGSYENFPSVNYLTFDNFGDIKSIIPLGNLLVVFFRDAIYFGRPTSIVNLPFTFTRLDTGTVGVIGQSAWCKFDDGIFFIGEDDVYYLSATSSVTPVGSPVAKSMLSNQRVGDWSRAVVDVETNRILFAIANNRAYVGLWSFNYKTKGWSRESADGGEGLFSLRLPSTNIWGDPPTIDGTLDIDGRGEFDTWGEESDLVSPATAGSLMGGIPLGSSETTPDPLSWELLQRSDGKTHFAFITKNTRFYVFDPYVTGACNIRIESGDFDLGVPDRKKTMNRIGVKLAEPIQNGVEFLLRVSTDRGRTWKTWLNNSMIIEPGKDETWFYFRATGSLFRFELKTTSTTEDFIISEIVLRGKPRGLEVR